MAYHFYEIIHSNPLLEVKGNHGPEWEDLPIFRLQHKYPKEIDTSTDLGDGYFNRIDLYTPKVIGHPVNDEHICLFNNWSKFNIYSGDPTIAYSPFSLMLQLGRDSLGASHELHMPFLEVGIGDPLSYDGIGHIVHNVLLNDRKLYK